MCESSESIFPIGVLTLYFSRSSESMPSRSPGIRIQTPLSRPVRRIFELIIFCYKLLRIVIVIFINIIIVIIIAHDWHYFQSGRGRWQGWGWHRWLRLRQCELGSGEKNTKNIHILDNDRVWTIVWYSSFWSEESINTPNSKLVLNLVPRDLNQLILWRKLSLRVGTNKQTNKKTLKGVEKLHMVMCVVWPLATLK